jgi:hypothetical protein
VVTVNAKQLPAHGLCTPPPVFLISIAGTIVRRLVIRVKD